VICDKQGLPLVVLSTAANVPDQRVLLEMLDAMPPVRMPRGRPRFRPGAVMGDRAYGTQALIAEVVERRIKSLLAPRSSQEHGSGLGKVRYVVERTLSWIGNYRRLKLCYERKPEHWQALNELAACVICANRIESLQEQRKIAA